MNQKLTDAQGQLQGFIDELTSNGARDVSVTVNPTCEKMTEEDYVNGVNRILIEYTKGNYRPMGPIGDAHPPVETHPMQPLVYGSDGVVRFKQNKIVDHLLGVASAAGCDLNKIHYMDFADEDRMQLAQLIGYSVGGYNELPYASDASVETANQLKAVKFPSTP